MPDFTKLCNNQVVALVRRVDQTTGEMVTREEVIAACSLPVGHIGVHKYYLREANEEQTQQSP